MVKHGGFFKRMKASQKRKDAKNKRGTMGRTKDERRERHNEKVDYFRAKREMEQLETISSSSEDMDSNSSGSEDDAAAKLNTLRSVLGCHDGNPKDDEDDFPLDDEEEEDEDHDIEGEEEEGDADAHDEEAEDDEEEEAVMCDGCNVSLDGDAVDGMVCITCEATFCAKCFKSRHGVRTGHKVVSLQEVDSGAAANALVGGAEDDGELDDDESFGDDELEGGGGDDDDDAEAEFVESESDDEANVAAEAQLLSLPTLNRRSTSVDGVLKHLFAAHDPWYEKYHADLYGEADATKLTPMDPSQLAAQTSAWPGVSMQASTHAARRIINKPAASNGKKGAELTAADGRPAHILPAVWERWTAFQTDAGREEPLSPMERAYLHCLSHYSDMLYTNRTWEQEPSLIAVSLLHVLNHHFKARTVIAAHNQVRRAKEAADKKKSISAKKGKKDADEPPASRTGREEMRDELEDDEDVDYRDRGFGKTRVLILLPMRNLALKYVNVMLAILGLEGSQQRNYTNFERDFSEVEEAKDPTFRRRPLEYRRQFDGNVNDTFCFGVSLNGGLAGKKSGGGGLSCSFYSHVLNSDIVFASPLGLRQRVEKNPDAYVGLSSIEVCLVDQSHVMLMQNWQHVKELLGEMLNKIPKDTTEGLSDMTRVYSWALDGKAAEHRQTIMISDWNSAAFLAALRTSVNNSGKIVVGADEKLVVGSLGKVLVPLRQHFRRCPATDRNSMDDDRFNFFVEKIVPSTLQPLIDRQIRTIIFIPSYFDYVKVRNYLYANHRESFTYLCEYTSLKAQRRALGQFTALEKSVLLLTERFYFFKRYFVKMAEQIIFYSPPLNPTFYWLLVGKLESKSPNAAAMTLYNRYDAHELMRIVGSERTPRLLTDPSDAFFFVTGA